MKGSIVNISGRECHLYKNSNAEFLLVQPIDEHDLEVLGQEVEIIKELSDKPFTLAAFMIKDWNQELTPWSVPPVFGKIPFGSGAEDTLKLTQANYYLLFKKERLMSYSAVILWLDYSHYGHLIRQTSLRE